jgi:Fe-S-cluster containining protein
MTAHQRQASEKAANLRRPPAPVPSATARSLEKKIVTILNRLIRVSHPSSLDKKFRSDYEKTLFLFSLYQDAVLADYPLKMSCGPRCGACCFHWPEDTYSFEVEYIADFLKKNRREEVPAIRSSLSGDIACLTRIKKTVSARLRDADQKAAIGGIDPYDIALSSFYLLKRPCPLLTRDGSCSIHPIRPFTCRVYISFSSKEYCKPSRIASDKALTYLLDLEQDASDLFDQLHFMYDVFDGDTSFRSMLYKALKRRSPAVRTS